MWTADVDEKVTQNVAETVETVPVTTENVSNEDSSDLISQDVNPLDDPSDPFLLNCLKEILAADDKPIYNLKKFNKYNVMTKTITVNRILKQVTPINITESKNLIQAPSSFVCKLQGAKKLPTKPKQEPWWKRRIEEDIEVLRKDLSVIES